MCTHFTYLVTFNLKKSHEVRTFFIAANGKLYAPCGIFKNVSQSARYKILLKPTTKQAGSPPAWHIQHVVPRWIFIFGGN